jgi:hypothetical protein
MTTRMKAPDYWFIWQTFALEHRSDSSRIHDPRARRTLGMSA